MSYENPPEVPGWVKAWFALEIPAFNALLKEADGTLSSGLLLCAVILVAVALQRRTWLKAVVLGWTILP